MLEINRNPSFWVEICSHEAVRGALFGLDPEEISALVANPQILPLASQNGGFILCPLDGFQRCFELHTLFKPEGWGREVTFAAREGLSQIFKSIDLIVTYEMDGNPRSRPPVTMGWKEAGPFSQSKFGYIKTWILSRSAWMASPVGRRVECPSQFH